MALIFWVLPLELKGLLLVQETAGEITLGTPVHHSVLFHSRLMEPRSESRYMSLRHVGVLLPWPSIPSTGYSCLHCPR